MNSQRVLARRIADLFSNRGEAALLLILGLFFGTLFTFGMSHWQSEVSREEAIPLTATYQSCNPKYQRHHQLTDIMLRFSDRDYLLVDGSYATESLLSTLESIPSGTKCAILVHPNSPSTILSLNAGEKEIIAFDEAVQKLAAEAEGFRYLGIFCYILAVYGLWKLLKRCA